MNRRVLLALPLAVLVACSGPDTTAPAVDQPPVSLDINDGAHTGGNQDFFFLPPLVLPTGPLTNWTRNAFNRLLSPRVEICPLNVTTAAAVTATTPCKTAAGFPVIISGTAVKKHFPPTADPTDVLSGLPDDWAHYHAQWKVPNPCNIVYRITVKVGDVKLGHADVVCVTSILGLLTIDYRKFGPALRGLNLQMPFRIEQWALCAVPGVGPCASAEVNLNVAAATISLPPNPGDPAGSQPSGVILPLQTPPLPPTVITVQDCPDLHASGVTDLPTFGRCIRITSNPALPPLANLATVFVCNLGIALPPGMSHEQSERITLHRFDVGTAQPLVALPHAAGCPQFEPPVSTGSIKGVLQELAQGHVASAGSQVLGMFAPKPVYARRLNLGAGGKTCCFSDFEFTIPAYMTIESGDGQVALPGSTLPNDPTVRVRDLGGENVAGARVHFAPANGSINLPDTVVTGSNGLASRSWTLGSTPGTNTLAVFGLGIAGSDNNGPRCGLDPFQAIQTGPFFPSEFGPGSPCGDGESNGPAETAVTVLTGSQTFTANGVLADVAIPVPFGSAGYDYFVLDSLTAGPTGWETSGFTPPVGWSNGPAPFVYVNEGDEYCGYHPGTAWPALTDILVRKTFTLGSSHDVVIKVSADNGIRAVYLNGEELSDGPLDKEGCAYLYGDYYFYGTAQAGPNVVAVRGHDHSGSTYLDVQVELDDFCESCGSASPSYLQSSIRTSDLVVGPRAPRVSHGPVRNPEAVKHRKVAKEPLH